jgi:hypothetical protein
MGSIVKALCGCGYEMEMYPGGGMRNFTTHCNFPFFCPHCAIMFEGNLFNKRIACPKCKAINGIPYDSNRICSRRGRRVYEWGFGDDTGRRPDLTDGDYLCPVCGRFTMTFVDVGCWD